MSNIIPIVLIIAAVVTVIVLLIWKNKKDKKLMNPDAQDSVEESIADHKRRADKV